jgi:hypothetical protein
MTRPIRRRGDELCGLFREGRHDRPGDGHLVRRRSTRSRLNAVTNVMRRDPCSRRVYCNDDLRSRTAVVLKSPPAPSKGGVRPWHSGPPALPVTSRPRAAVGRRVSRAGRRFRSGTAQFAFVLPLVEVSRPPPSVGPLSSHARRITVGEGPSLRGAGPSNSTQACLIRSSRSPR